MLDIAVRLSPISALGAHCVAICMPIGGADVRLFGEKWMLVATVDHLSFGTAFAAKLAATILVIIKTMNHQMKRILGFLFAAAVIGLSREDLMAQPLPDGFEWVYGCWENPRTGDCYIIGKDGIRENMTRHWVGHCFLKEYPTLDVWSEPLRPYEFASFDGRRILSYSGPFECDRYFVIGNQVLQEPGENGDRFVKRQAPPAKRKAGATNRALGRWELAETGVFTLEISESTIKRKTPRGIHESTYSVSEEGYLITDLDVFVFEDGVLHRYYSNTESYIISTYIRPAGTVIPLSDLP